VELTDTPNSCAPHKARITGLQQTCRKVTARIAANIQVILLVVSALWVQLR